MSVVRRHQTFQFFKPVEDDVDWGSCRIKLKHLDSWTSARQANAKRYAELFRHYELLNTVEIPITLPEHRHVFNQYTIRLKAGQRDKVLSHLREHNLGCGIYYPKPLHLQPCFEHLGYRAGDLPESEDAANQVLSLPIYAELTPYQQELVVRGIAHAVGHGSSTGNNTPIPQPKFLKSADICAA